MVHWEGELLTPSGDRHRIYFEFSTPTTGLIRCEPGRFCSRFFFRPCRQVSGLNLNFRLMPSR